MTAPHIAGVQPVRGELLISLEEPIAMPRLLNYALENGTAIPSSY